VKKLFNVIVLLLAINFLAVAGGAAWLVKTQHVDRDKIKQIKNVLFPAPATQPTTQPVADGANPPTLNLDQLVAKESGKSAAQQVEDIQHTFDAQMAELDRREREIKDLKQQTDIAQAQVAKDRAELQADQAVLQKQKDEANKLASDQGFQDALARYIAMDPKQVKQIFMTLDDQTVMNYLEAMEPRPAAKIIKEFKTDDEIARIQKVLERMRQPQASTKE
jgi:hypothetical protein